MRNSLRKSDAATLEVELCRRDRHHSSLSMTRDGSYSTSEAGGLMRKLPGEGFRLVSAMLLLLISVSCSDGSTGAAGTWAVSGRVTDSTGRAVGNALVQARLYAPECNTSPPSAILEKRTSSSGDYRFDFPEMFELCLRLSVTPPGGNTVVVDRSVMHARVNDRFVIDIVVP